VKERDGKIDADSSYAKRKVAMWENLQKPINASKTKQWEKELSPKQIKSIDQMSGEYYQRLLNHQFGFEPQGDALYNAFLKLSMASLKYKIRCS